MKRGNMGFWCVFVAYYIAIAIVWYLLRSSENLVFIFYRFLQYWYAILPIIVLFIWKVKSVSIRVILLVLGFLILTFITNTYLDTRIEQSQLFHTLDKISYTGFIDVQNLSNISASGYQYDAYIWGNKKVRLSSKTYLSIEFSQIQVNNLNIKKPTNSGNYFYDENLWNKGYIGISSLGKYKDIFCSQKNIGIFQKLRLRLRSILNLGYGQDSKATNLLRGMFFGDRTALDPGQKEVFTNSGISHLVVASGQNLAILSKLTEQIFYIFPYNIRQIFIVLIAFLYSCLVGDEASIWRAFFLVMMVALAKLLGRKVDVLYVLVLSSLVLSLFTPFLLFIDLGFQLSYMAFLGVYFSSGFFKDSFIKNTLAILFVVQVFTSPIIIYTFGKINLMGVFGNIVAIFFVPVIVFLFPISYVFGSFTDIFYWVYQVFENINALISVNVVYIEYEMNVVEYLLVIFILLFVIKKFHSIK